MYGLFDSWLLNRVTGERAFVILVAERIWLGDYPNTEDEYDPLADFASCIVVAVVCESISRADIPSKSLGLLWIILLILNFSWLLLRLALLKFLAISPINSLK